jgi:hypothetical protein
MQITLNGRAVIERFGTQIPCTVDRVQKNAIQYLTVDLLALLQLQIIVGQVFYALVSADTTLVGYSAILYLLKERQRGTVQISIRSG